MEKPRVSRQPPIKCRENKRRENEERCEWKEKGGGRLGGRLGGTGLRPLMISPRYAAHLMKQVTPRDF